MTNPGADSLRQLGDLADRLDAERLRYRSFFEQAPDPYVVTDLRGVIRECSRRAVETFGPWLVGRPLAILVAREQWAAYDHLLARLATRHAHGEATLTFRNGRATLRMRVRCRRLEDGTLLWLLRDVTGSESARARLADLARRDEQLADELRQLDEYRRAFLMAVSHDLRTPIAAVAGLAGLLASQPGLSAADRTRVVHMIQENAERAAALFTDLLDLERLERHDLVLRREHVDVGELVAHVAQRAEVGRRELVVEVEAVDEQVDPVLVERIVENLLRNAAHHTPEGTRVWVRCRREPDGVAVVVEDDGPGVPAELAPKVFSLFQRDRRPGAAGGLGIGLPLVQAFARLHGGRVHLEQREGGGTAFTVLLPGGTPVSQRAPAGDGR